MPRKISQNLASWAVASWVCGELGGGELGGGGLGGGELGGVEMSVYGKLLHATQTRQTLLQWCASFVSPLVARTTLGQSASVPLT